MANLETGSQSTDLFETTGAEKLNEQEFQTTFDDEFFDNLESDDPLKKIYMQEIGDKVYFEKPNKVNFQNPESSYTKIRFARPDGVFVDRFWISKADWENIKNRRDNLNGAIQTTQAEAQDLKDTVQEGKESIGDSIETHVDNLLQKYEKFEKWPLPKRAGESLKTRNRFKDVIRTNIAYLKSIKRELKRYDYTYEPERFNENLEILEYNIKQLEKVRTIVVEGGDTSNIPGIISSLRDIKKIDKFETKMEKYYEEADTLLQHAALQELANKDREGLKDYLVGVLSGEIEHPLQDRFYKQYEKDFLYVASLDLSLYNKITTCQNPRKRGGQQGEVYNGSAVVVCPGKSAQHCEKKPGVFDKGGEMFADGLAKLGLIDENDTTKKEAWGKFGKVALLGLGAFAIYKMIKEKDGKRWAWIGGTAAVLLGMANKDALYKRWGDAIGKSNPTSQEVLNYANSSAGNTTPTGVEAQEIMDNRISPSTTVISAFGNMSINSMVEEGIIYEDSHGDLAFDYEKYVRYVDTNITDEKDRTLNLDAGERLKKNPTWLKQGLICLGISNMDTLRSVGQDKDNILGHDGAINYIDNISSPINADISRQGFKPRDNEARYKIIHENSGKSSISKQDLNRYIREGLIVPKDESLAEYIYSPLTNLEEKCMIGFEKLKFDTIEELLKAVKLTTRIITNFKGRTTVRSSNPFHLGMGLVGNIEFDDGVINDTDVIKSNILKNTLKDISPTLNNNKHGYVAFLNNLWNNDTVFEKVDLSGYPILSAIGIDFYNEQEADEVEKWLTEIKEGTKFSQATIDGQPFRVRWAFKNLGNSLVFTAVNGDKEVFREDISKKFPTLMGQKDKLLAFLNDPQNKMWGSAIN